MKTYRFLHILTGNYRDFEYLDFPIKEIRGEFFIMFQSYIATKTDYESYSGYSSEEEKIKKVISRIQKKYGIEHTGEWHNEIVGFLIKDIMSETCAWEDLNLIEFDISEVEDV